jgi:peroxiredoxin
LLVYSAMNSTSDEQINGPPQPQEKQAAIPGLGLAVAALVLGVASIPFSLMVIGAVYGVIGVVLAIVHLKSKYPLRAVAVWGLSLSGVGLLLGAGFGAYYMDQYLRFQKSMAAFDSQQFEQWVNKKAPDFSVKDLDGNEITLSALKGRRVILDFWATWCPPCRREIPHLVELAKTFDSNDLVIIGISSESAETIRSFTEGRGINYTLVSAQDLPSPYSDITSIPTTFFIDRQGLIRNVEMGYHDFDELKAAAVNLDTKPDVNELN